MHKQQKLLPYDLAHHTIYLHEALEHVSKADQSTQTICKEHVCSQCCVH